MKDLKFDWLITFGAYDELVTRKLLVNGFPRERVVNLGFSVNPSMEQIIDTIAGMVPEGFQALLVGFVNIHTPQAEMMMEYFKNVESHDVEITSQNQIGYMTLQKFEMAHDRLEVEHA